MRKPYTPSHEELKSMLFNKIKSHIYEYYGEDFTIMYNTAITQFWLDGRVIRPENKEDILRLIKMLSYRW